MALSRESGAAHETTAEPTPGVTVNRIVDAGPSGGGQETDGRGLGAATVGVALGLGGAVPDVGDDDDPDVTAPAGGASTGGATTGGATTGGASTGGAGRGTVVPPVSEGPANSPVGPQAASASTPGTTTSDRHGLRRPRLPGRLARPTLVLSARRGGT
ncbi:hypothetical protein KMZ32_03930 [Phycicoccus sp. MAQZ13P-2]|uniref:hypothetical protein n=1 Tax=Phycicoccus mangrovi TaxID=2840470 RepID=UPI001C007598|nr:hypothetical protein [Phycicoccus mangrovi]MBT9254574.1 hypothetical protein [Phycicoccus mangrovi]MBT9273221.1 hypothetical protein [Phycicoccus mangrovi]